MTPRLAKILDAYDSFNSTTRKRLVAGNLYDYFMQEFRGEIEMIYNSATKEDIKEDVKGMAEIIYKEEEKEKRDFLVGVLLDIVKWCKVIQMRWVSWINCI